MIEFKNLSFSYSKGKPIFEDVNLEWKSGHLYGLLGRNGAGKTTLLKIMTGLLFPSEGQVTLNGQPSQKRDDEQLKNLYYLQEEIYVPHLKIDQFEKAFAPFYPNFRHEDFEYYLNEMDLMGEFNYIDKMSHGQKKKVMIAFALATNVQLLIMDEPTNGLDIPAKSIFRKLMASYAEDDRTVIISTHQVRDLHSLIDAVTILDRGNIIMNASTDVICDKLYFGTEDQLNENESVFYSEDTPRGMYVVKENTQHQDSHLDLELLFNAAVSNSDKFKSMFQ